MLKLFLPLYVLLAIAITAFIFGIAVLPEIILKDSISDYIHGISKGPHYLFQKQLADKPLDTWPEHIRSLQPFFGYPLSIQRLEEVDLMNTDLFRLRQGKAVYFEIDDVDYVYLPLDDSPYVLSIPLDPTQEELGQRIMMGVFHLLMKELQDHPPTSWLAIIDEQQDAFSFPITLMRMDALDLKEVEFDRLHQGEILVFDYGEDTESYYKRVDDTPFALKLGPIPVWLVEKVFDYVVYASFATIIAITVLLWVRPLWHGMVALRQATVTFGRGDFTARVLLPGRSALASLANTFNSMADRIQRLIDSHKELTNAVSHELRTPIARLRFGVEMLENAPNEATRARFIASMNADIDELDSLVTELLTYARFDRETPHLKLKRESLLPWLGSLVEQVQEETPPVSLHCKFDPDNKDVLATFEPRLMERAIGNLLRNAHRYAEGRVEVSVDRNGQDFQICIDDDGPGIPSADRERVFEPFTRLDTSRDRSSGGYGLGLAIVKRIAQWHGGQAFVTDSPLGGACFCVRWPGGAALSPQANS